jgi:hypothetical protein
LISGFTVTLLLLTSSAGFVADGGEFKFLKVRWMIKEGLQLNTISTIVRAGEKLNLKVWARLKFALKYKSQIQRC